jgi:hypothetical protein
MIAQDCFIPLRELAGLPTKTSVSSQSHLRSKLFLSDTPLNMATTQLHVSGVLGLKCAWVTLTVLIGVAGFNPRALGQG